MTTKMQQRRGTAAQWTSANTVLAAGELGVETDTHRVKCGDGSTAWNSLSYLTLADGEVTSAKIADGTIVNADINASAAIALSKLGAGALTEISSITDQAMATATLGTELGDGVNLTQALTGLTIGQSYYIAPVSGTMTGVTLDGAALPALGNISSFVATATSHTVVGTAGTATAISVKLVTARPITVATLISGTRVSGQADNTFVSAPPLKLAGGGGNAGFGWSALSATVSGANNTAMGVYTLYSLVNGNRNTAVGSNSLYGVQSGSYNVGLGYAAGFALTTGDNNTSVGSNSGRAFTTGSNNLALGYNAGYSGTTATLSGTVCIGTSSGGAGAQATADNQIALGTSAHSTLIAGSLEMTGSGTGVIVRSPDGTRYRLGVANGGAVSVAAL